MKKYLIELINNFNECNTDEERFRFIIDHEGIFGIVLDNDWTGVMLNYTALSQHFTDDEIKELPEINSIDHYVGNGPGLFSLFKTLGIRVESV